MFAWESFKKLLAKGVYFDQIAYILTFPGQNTSVADNFYNIVEKGEHFYYE